VFLVLRLSFSGQLIASAIGFVVWAPISIQHLQQMEEDSDASVSLLLRDSLQGIPFMIFVMAYGVVAAAGIHDAMRGDFLQQRTLHSEEKAFSILLDNMLPSHVITKLEEQCAGLGVWGGMYWENEPMVTVIFCDLQEFDNLVSSRDASQLVAILDMIYTLFDRLSQKHGVKKMETVGKTWMGCAGLHGAGGNHAAKAVILGLDMIASLGRIVDA